MRIWKNAHSLAAAAKEGQLERFLKVFHELVGPREFWLTCMLAIYL